MKTFKILSAITNKIGNLTNRVNINNLTKSIIKENDTSNYEQKLEQNIEKAKSAIESIKLQNNSDKNFPNIKKYIDKLKIYLDKILELLFELMDFNKNTFHYLIESKLIPTLSENINLLDKNSLSNLIMPYLIKLIFIEPTILMKGKLKEEFIIMNTQIIGCIKKIIFEFKNIVNKINIININSELYNFINEGILPFMDNLFSKIIKYPNFYYALLNDSSSININLELLLFEILINLFKFEHQIKNRSSRTINKKKYIKIYK